MAWRGMTRRQVVGKAAHGEMKALRWRNQQRVYSGQATAPRRARLAHGPPYRCSAVAAPLVRATPADRKSARNAWSVAGAEAKLYAAAVAVLACTIRRVISWFHTQSKALADPAQALEGHSSYFSLLAGAKYGFWPTFQSALKGGPTASALLRRRSAAQSSSLQCDTSTAGCFQAAGTASGARAGARSGVWGFGRGSGQALSRGARGRARSRPPSTPAEREACGGTLTRQPDGVVVVSAKHSK